MMGTGNQGSPGLYVLSAFDIFRCVQNESYSHLEVWVSFYEIYCGKLFDLLNDKNLLHAREDGKQNICIVGLTEKQVVNFSQMMQVIEFGLKSRTVGVTGANSDSSRSHGIIQICLKESNTGNTFGKISFIDLAGSERAVDTKETNKQTRMDGAEINKSLLALKECIRALDQDKPYLPFRGSKLTLVLRDSFVGNCKTLMIANVSPCSSCAEHTLNTLRYADRVKELKKEKNNTDSEKDPQEVMANLMMMPRQHSKKFLLIFS
jgi:kinesin family protein 2/24